MLRSASDYLFADGSGARGEILPVRARRGVRDERLLVREDAAYLAEAAAVAALIATGESGSVVNPTRRLDRPPLDHAVDKLFAAHDWPFLAPDAALRESCPLGDNPFRDKAAFDRDYFFGDDAALTRGGYERPTFGRALALGPLRQAFAAVQRLERACVTLSEVEIPLRSSFTSPRAAIVRGGVREPTDNVDVAGVYVQRTLLPGVGQWYNALFMYRDFAPFWSAYTGAGGYGVGVGERAAFPLVAEAVVSGWVGHPVMASPYTEFQPRADTLAASAAASRAATAVAGDVRLRLGEIARAVTVEQIVLWCMAFGYAGSLRPIVLRVPVEDGRVEDGWITIPAAALDAARLMTLVEGSGIATSGNGLREAGLYCYGAAAILRPHYEISSTGWQG